MIAPTATAAKKSNADISASVRLSPNRNPNTAVTNSKAASYRSQLRAACKQFVHMCKFPLPF